MAGTCVIRADSGHAIGVGHVSRCLTLAHALRSRAVAVRFVCRAHHGAALDWIEVSGFPAHRLPVANDAPEPAGYAEWLGEDWRRDAERTAGIIRDTVGTADWLVVDHYGIGEAWEKTLRGAARRIFVIDDLADRRHDCDLLLDQNLVEGNPYGTLVPASAKLLLGPRYALLREEFGRERRRVAARTGEVRRVLVFFGGSDPTDETSKALKAFRLLNPRGIEVDVIVGDSNPRKEAVAALCGELPYVRFHCQVSDMASRLARADLALGAAGVSSWERLALGVPALVVAVADNQLENMRQLDHAGVAIGLGAAAQVDVAALGGALVRALANPARLREMSAKALSLVDARGADRVADELTGGDA